MLGPGGLATIILAAYFGRLPVLWYFVIIAFLTAAWCAAATSFNSFMAARVLNGFFSTVAQGVGHVHSIYSWMKLTYTQGGLMFIKDIFFFHEHPYVYSSFARQTSLTQVTDAKSTSGPDSSSSHPISAPSLQLSSSPPRNGNGVSGS
jgi:hypothetical protein